MQALLMLCVQQALIPPICSVCKSNWDAFESAMLLVLVR